MWNLPPIVIYVIAVAIIFPTMGFFMYRNALRRNFYQEALKERRKVLNKFKLDI